MAPSTTPILTITVTISLLLRCHMVFSEIVPFTCVNRESNTVIGYNTASTISCESNETMVSCGIKGYDDIGGTFIENGICTALNLNNETYGIISLARCCTFPPDVVLSISTPSSLPNLTATTTCTDANSVLTGCHVYYDSGTPNRLRGSYTNDNITAINNTWQSTNNRCNAEASEGSITASATCVSIHADYTLRCETNAQWTNYANFGGCNVDYTMTACNTFDIAIFPNLDKYYIDSDEACYVQKRSNNEMYANAICCQLWRKTPSPTYHPISPTSAHTAQGETKAQLRWNSASDACKFNCVQCLEQIDIVGRNALWSMTFTGNNTSDCECPNEDTLTSNDDGDTIDIDNAQYSLQIEKYIINIHDSGDDEAIEYAIRLNVLSWNAVTSNCTISYFVNENEFLGVMAHNILTMTFSICGLPQAEVQPEVVLESERQLKADLADLFNVSLTQVNVSIAVGSFCEQNGNNRRLLRRGNDQEVTVIIVFTKAEDAKAAGDNACDEADAVVSNDIEDCEVVVHSSDAFVPHETPTEESVSGLASETLAAVIVTMVLLFLVIFVICYLYESRKQKQQELELFAKYHESAAGDSLGGAVARLPDTAVSIKCAQITPTVKNAVSNTTENVSAVEVETMEIMEYKSEEEMLEAVVASGKANDIKREDLIMEEQIGSGHFGAVYKAMWNGNMVAVKQLMTEGTENDDDAKDVYESAAQQRLAHAKEMKAEIILASSLPIHNNLVEIFGYTQSPFGVVMTYIPGGSVQKYVYRKYKKENDPIPTMRELLIILNKAASGLKFLHQYGLVHRDIACRNILLGQMRNNHIEKSTEVRISDFGLTRQLQLVNKNAQHVQKTVSAIGPLKWMAPESIKENEYSKKSDVYMFGITMWEMFYGMEPYVDVTAINAAMKVVTKGERPEIINDPEKYRHTIMIDEYKEIMKECWHQEPMKRPAFSQVLSQLEQIVVSSVNMIL